MSINRRLKRIQAEFNKLMKTKPDWLNISLYDNSIDKWKVIIEGPEASVYEGGKFEYEITFPDNYPHKPPNIKIMTQIYSPFINEERKNYCCCILMNENNCFQWIPTCFVIDILNLIKETFHIYEYFEGNERKVRLGNEKFETHFCSSNFSNIFYDNPGLFIDMAKEWTRKYAQ